MKLFDVDFEGVTPVGNCLFILAKDLEEATKIAKETCWTEEFSITEISMDESKVVIYLSGDY